MEHFFRFTSISTNLMTRVSLGATIIHYLRQRKNPIRILSCSIYIVKFHEPSSSSRYSQYALRVYLKIVWNRTVYNIHHLINFRFKYIGKMSPSLETDMVSTCFFFLQRFSLLDRGCFKIIFFFYHAAGLILLLELFVYILFINSLQVLFRR